MAVTMLLRIIDPIQLYTPLPKRLVAVFYLMKYSGKICEAVTFVSS